VVDETPAAVAEDSEAYAVIAGVDEEASALVQVAEIRII
jgi:hypothetical protein